MPTSYEQQILKIHNTRGAMENLSIHEAWELIETINTAREAIERATLATNPSSPYDFTPKELKLLEYCWFFCCNFLAKNRIYKSTKYGFPNKEYKYTKKIGSTLLTALKEVALAPGVIRPTEIKLSQIIDHPQLKKIIQQAESDNSTPSISITIPGFTIQALKGKKVIGSNTDQLQIKDPPTQFTIKLNATQN